MRVEVVAQDQTTVVIEIPEKGVLDPKQWIPIPKCPVRFSVAIGFVTAAPRPDQPPGFQHVAGTTIWTSPRLGREGGPGPLAGAGRHWENNEVPLNPLGNADNLLRLPSAEAQNKEILEGDPFPVVIQFQPAQKSEQPGERPVASVRVQFSLAYVSIHDFRLMRTHDADETKRQYGYTLHSVPGDARVEVWFEGRLVPAVPAGHQMAPLSLLLRVTASPTDDSHGAGDRVRLHWYDAKPEIRSMRESGIRFDKLGPSLRDSTPTQYYFPEAGERSGTFRGFLNYRGYPARNHDFGRKTLTVSCDGHIDITAEFEIFFPVRDRVVHPQNHPTETGVDPPDAPQFANWFYYWGKNKQGPGNHDFSTSAMEGGIPIEVTNARESEKDDPFGEKPDPATVGKNALGWGRADGAGGGRITLYDGIVLVGKPIEMNFAPGAYLLPLSTGASRVVPAFGFAYKHGGVDSSRHIFAHELRHVEQLVGQARLDATDLVDSDEDMLRDLWEDALGTSFLHKKTFGPEGILETQFKIGGKAQGDHEFDADFVGHRNEGVVAADQNWAFPWKSESAGDTGKDTNANAEGFQWRDQ